MFHLFPLLVSYKRYFNRQHSFGNTEITVLYHKSTGQSPQQKSVIIGSLKRLCERMPPMVLSELSVVLDISWPALASKISTSVCLHPQSLHLNPQLCFS